MCERGHDTTEHTVETERLIAEALYHRRPVYMAIPSDVADTPVLGTAASHNPATGDPGSLAAATDAVAPF